MKITLLAALLIFGKLFCLGQTTDSMHFNKISFTVLPMLRPFTESHAEIVGLEYERKIHKDFYLSAHIDFGNFLDYKFYDYYNYFNSSTNPHYTLEDVIVNGFHLKIIPRLHLKEIWRFKLFAGLPYDYHWYSKNVDVYNSETSNSTNYSATTSQSGLGIDFGINFKINKRFFVAANTSIYRSITLKTQTNDYIAPQNGYWRSDDLMYWAELFIQFGYKF